MTRKATIKDVARAAGVSDMTVSRAANRPESVSVETRAKIFEAMESLGYKPNALARSMRHRSTHQIGYLTADLTITPNAVMAQSAGQTFAEAGYRQIIAISNGQLELEHKFLEQFQSGIVDGIIPMISDESSQRTVDLLENCGVPIVAIDRDLHFAVDAVLSDHRTPMIKAVKYLHDIGHRDIALLCSPQTMRPGRIRSAAFVEAARQLGHRDPAARVFSMPQRPEEAFAATQFLLSHADRPTALIAAANQLVFGVLQAVQSLGMSIPNDVSVIGADDNIISPLFRPALTMISRDLVEIGKAAASLLIERIQQPETAVGRILMLGSDVVLRDSCASPQKGNRRKS